MRISSSSDTDRNPHDHTTGVDRKLRAKRDKLIDRRQPPETGKPACEGLLSARERLRPSSTRVLSRNSDSMPHTQRPPSAWPALVAGRRRHCRQRLRRTAADRGLQPGLQCCRRHAGQDAGTQDHLHHASRAEDRGAAGRLQGTRAVPASRKGLTPSPATGTSSTPTSCSPARGARAADRGDLRPMCRRRAAYSPAPTDFVITTRRNNAHTLLTGPETIKAATGRATTMAEVGGAEMH